MIVHIADILAIPFFILLTNYFHRKKNRTIQERILFLFGIIGTILDISFTLFYFYKK